jgi:hypothetical protein
LILQSKIDVAQTAYCEAMRELRHGVVTIATPFGIPLRDNLTGRRASLCETLAEEI